MANPKYAGLPGIAPPDEKDVYETDDLPEADQDIDFNEESESDNIERPHISIADAHDKFKDKVLIGGKELDFSDRLRRRRHVGYYAKSGNWEIAAQGEDETVIQKYHRIQCEIRELLQEISEMKKNAADTKNEELLASAALVPQLEDALTQLNNFQLSETLGKDFIASISDPQGTQIKKLLNQVQVLKENSGKQKQVKPKEKPSGDIQGVLTYQLQSLPDHTKLQNTSKINDLMMRLVQLETVIGANSDSFNRLKAAEYRNLNEAVTDLAAKVSLLDPTQIDRVETKLAAVASRMDSVAEKRGGDDTKDRDNKINELYDILKNTEALSASLPPVLDRLITLKEFQSSASNFKKSLSEFETNNNKMALEINKNENTLRKIKEAMQAQLESITTTTKSFDARLQALKK